MPTAVDRLIKRFHASRADVRLGLIVAPIAVLGLASSVLTRNQDLFGTRVPLEDQKALLAVAVGILVITVAKGIVSLRNTRKL